MKLRTENLLMTELHSIYKFNNNYGASVINNSMSYGGDKGLYEIAVLEFDDDVSSICYDTNITDNVIGYLTKSEVNKLLTRISKL